MMVAVFGQVYRFDADTVYYSPAPVYHAAPLRFGGIVQSLAAPLVMARSEVHQTLESWRRVAWLVSARGHDGYRHLLAEAERRTRTGERAPGSVSLEQVRAIAERLG
jgi:hypothetical protein